VGRGQGFEFRAPMAIAVIGGVITSTFLTLFVVPLVFAVLQKMIDFVKRLLGPSGSGSGASGGRSTRTEPELPVPALPSVAAPANLATKSN
jgi:hypothetical protein